MKQFVEICVKEEKTHEQEIHDVFLGAQKSKRFAPGLIWSSMSIAEDQTQGTKQGWTASAFDWKLVKFTPDTECEDAFLSRSRSRSSWRSGILTRRFAFLNAFNKTVIYQLKYIFIHYISPCLNRDLNLATTMLK